MKTKKEKKEKTAKSPTTTKDKKIRERRWVEKWLGATVFTNEDNAVIYMITAVDLVRGMVLCGQTWRSLTSVTRLKGTSKKSWHRKPAYVDPSLI